VRIDASQCAGATVGDDEEEVDCVMIVFIQLTLIQLTHQRNKPVLHILAPPLPTPVCHRTAPAENAAAKDGAS
jgi:hypothetical protein